MVQNLMSTPMTGVRGSAYKRFKKLEDDRSSWRGQWIEITDYLLPRRGRYLTESQSTKGRKRNTKIIDNTAGQALRTLSAGMMSGLTSPARPWFRFLTEDPGLMEEEGVKAYLGMAEQAIRRILSATNFYNSAATSSSGRSVRTRSCDATTRSACCTIATSQLASTSSPRTSSDRSTPLAVTLR